MPSSSTYRVYWEDTDAGGVVYYANYLKFAERARTEALRALGFDQSALLQTHNIAIVVRRCEVDFMSPARLDDEITVQTHLRELGRASMTMHQTLSRKNGAAGAKDLVTINVLLACVNASFKPVAWPQEVKHALKSAFAKV